MLLIADSGSTKCDWMLIQDNAESLSFSTMGFNPYFHNEAVISNAIRQNTAMCNFADQVTMLFLYSAGCSSKELKLVVERALRSVFPKANIYVDHDLIGAAFATWDDTPAITGILGTGSNSCFFDGDIVKQANNGLGLGYILGDEGSGSWYGKILLRQYLANALPEELHTILRDEYTLDRQTIVEGVYMKPHANVYLASFMKVLSDNKENDWVQEIVNKGMAEFLKTHVQVYKNYQRVPTHMIGSIAYNFEDNLRKVGATMGVQVGTIIQKPIFGLVNYHMKHHFQKK
ncbi:MAG: BadF/BadG/BcrA/BcrD ATPase family protein [Bacteroidia bacterium]|jgi:glucosamine kinase